MMEVQTRFDRIRAMPVSLRAEHAREAIASGTRGFHESLLRTWHILNEVKRYCEAGVPSKIVRELIAEMEGQPWP